MVTLRYKNIKAPFTVGHKGAYKFLYTAIKNIKIHFSCSVFHYLQDKIHTTTPVMSTPPELLVKSMN